MMCMFKFKRKMNKFVVAGSAVCVGTYLLCKFLREFVVSHEINFEVSGQGPDGNEEEEIIIPDDGSDAISTRSETPDDFVATPLPAEILKAFCVAWHAKNFEDVDAWTPLVVDLLKTINSYLVVHSDGRAEILHLFSGVARAVREGKTMSVLERIYVDTR